MKLKFEWERLTGMKAAWTYRAKVIGGWVLMSEESHMVFIPDPTHEWEIEK